MRICRTSQGCNIHIRVLRFSVVSLTHCLTDGDNASTGYGYTDIVDFIIQNGVNVEKNLEELYRRVAFNIIIGNSDDHFRNHGFLLTRKGWELSPAYDMNPTLSEHQNLLNNRTTSESNLDILMASSDEYMIPKERAEAIIKEVKVAMKNWQSEASKLGIPQRKLHLFSHRINRSLTSE